MASELTVVHLSERDVQGGAARATYRLHTGLRKEGVDSRMLVNYKASDDDTVHGPSGKVGKLHSELRRKVDELPSWRYRDRRESLFSSAWVPEAVHRRVRRLDPDVINCHWITGGFVRPSTLSSFDVPVVWTLHDMWPFTGGCHYSGGCDRHTDQCGACPHLGSSTEADLSRRVWTRKRDAWADFDPHVVTPSNWLADCVRRSALLGDRSLEVIPNGLDLAQFSPSDTTAARRRLGLPQDRALVLFGAHYDTPRKGYHHLVDASSSLPSDVELVTFGSGGSDDHGLDRLVHSIGYVPEEALIELYGAADAIVVPSEQDNLPNTVLEGMACGTPAVAFDIGGMSDMIDHGTNGYLADPFDAEDLASGIADVVADPDLGEQARQTVEARFSIEKSARTYLDLYQSVTADS